MTSLKNFTDTEISVIYSTESIVTMDWHDLNGRGFWGDFWTVAITHHQVTSKQNQKSNHFLLWTGSTNSDFPSHPESPHFTANSTRTAIRTPKLHLNYPHYPNISTTIRSVYSEPRDEGLVERKRKLSHSNNSYNITARARPLIAWKRLWWIQTGNIFFLFIWYSPILFGEAMPFMAASFHLCLFESTSTELHFMHWQGCFQKLRVNSSIIPLS